MHSEWLIGLTFVLTASLGVVSGMSGGGAGFFMVPYYIFIGLTPQQAVATGKMGGLGMSTGAITAFRGKGLVSKRYIVPFLAITSACALLSAWLIPRIDGAVFQTIIGWMLIIMIPTLFIKTARLQPGERSRPWIVAGFIVYTIVSLAQTMFGTGIGTILVLVLMFLFGLNALQANATKRVAQFSQAIILFVLLLLQGLVVVGHGIAAMLGSMLGSHVGSRIAIKKGSGFIKIMLAIVMLISGIALLI